MKPVSQITSFEQWPKEARRFYEGMLISLGINSSVLVHPDQQEVAEEILAAAEEDRLPRVHFDEREE